LDSPEQLPPLLRVSSDRASPIIALDLEGGLDGPMCEALVVAFAVDELAKVVSMEWICKSNLTLQRLSEHRISALELTRRRAEKASAKIEEQAIDLTEDKNDSGKGYSPRNVQRFVNAVYSLDSIGSRENRAVIDGLRALQKLYQHAAKSEAEEYNQRPLALGKAIAALRACGRKVGSKEDAMSLDFVSQKIAATIEQLSLTGTCDRIRRLSADRSIRVIQTFTPIVGVGKDWARKFDALGIESVKALQQQVQAHCCYTVALLLHECHTYDTAATLLLHKCRHTVPGWH
jgi:hypothetical protein